MPPQLTLDRWGASGDGLLVTRTRRAPSSSADCRRVARAARLKRWANGITQRANLAANAPRGLAQTAMREPSRQAADPTLVHRLRLAESNCKGQKRCRISGNSPDTTRASRAHCACTPRTCHVSTGAVTPSVTGGTQPTFSSGTRDTRSPERVLKHSAIQRRTPRYRRRLTSTPSAACESSAAQRTGRAHAGCSRRRKQ